MDTDDSSNKHFRFLRIAVKLAQTVPFVHKFGCVVVKGGRILSTGKNCYENHRHAEVCALSKRDDLKGAVLYIARIRKEQPFGLSKPCPNCQVAIRVAGISQIVYTTNDSFNPIMCERL